jgi:hypothetical protein
MYVKDTYNYFHDFKTPVKYAMREIKIVIENGRSLKLRQTRQVEASLLSTTGMQPTTNKGYTAHQWAVRRVRSG